MGRDLSGENGGVSPSLVSDRLICFHVLCLFVKIRKYQENFYIGCTSNLRRRINEHRSGNTQTTRGKNPKLIYYEEFINKELALKREDGWKASGSVYNSLIRRLGLK